MTEKRFTLDDGLIWDNGEECEDVVDLLNELSEENEQLKQHIDFADKLIDELGHEEMKRQWEEYE